MKTIDREGNFNLHTILQDIDENFTNTPFESMLNYYDTEDSSDYRNAFLECVTYCQANKVTMYIPEGTYYISGVITVTGDISIYAPNVILESDIESLSFITFNGSISSYTSITESLIKGQNYIKSTLASSLSINDLVKIISDEPLCPDLVNYGEEFGRGEMALVRNIDTVNNIIYLHQPLLDNYSTINWSDKREDPALSTLSNVRMAKITPAKINIAGNPVIKNITTAFEATDDSCNGIVFKYCKDLSIDITIENFVQRLVRLHHCFGGILNVNGYGGMRRSNVTGDGSPGYGVEILGTTMNIEINGNISGCRHSVVHNADEGVSWNNPINGVFYGARTNAIIDCHSPCGNMVIGNVVLNGGSIVVIEDSLNPAYNPDTGDKSTPYGIECGAKYNYIGSVIMNNLNIGLLHRDSCGIESIEIESISTLDVHTLISFRSSGNVTSYINNMSVNNINAKNCTKLFSYSHRAYKGKDIIFNKIQCDGQLLTASSGLRSDSDKTNIVFNNVQHRRNSDIAVSSFMNINASSNCINCVKINGQVIDQGKLINIPSTSSVQDIILNGLKYTGSDLINIQGDTAIDRCNLVKITNCEIEIANTNLLNFEEAAQTVKNLIYDNNYIIGATQITNGTATNSIAGNTIFDN